jgi:small subunit ribosomal protein S21
MRPQQQKPYHQRKHFTKNKQFDKKKRPMSFDQMLRQFKKKVERAGTIQELRKREYFEKPAQKKQRKMKEAVRREQKLQEQNNTLGRPRFY